MLRTVAVLALAAGLAAGCSGGSDQPTAEQAAPATPTAMATTPPASGGRYSTPEEIKAALDAAGLSCAGLRLPDQPSDNDVDRKSCTPDDGKLTFLAVYSPESPKLSSEVEFVRTSGFLEASILAGENWTIVGSDQFVEDAAKVLGGTVTTSP
jgi:hypothetical protein